MNRITMALLGATSLSTSMRSPEDGTGAKPPIDPSRLDLSIGGGDTDIVENGKARSKPNDGMSMDFNNDGTTELTGIGEGIKEGEETGDDVAGDTEAGDETNPEEKAGDEEAEEVAYEPLPDYTEETAEAYKERFLKTTDEGVEINRDAIEAEIRANMAKPEGERTERPNEGTYKFLKEELGIPRSMVDDHIEGEKAKAAQITAAFEEATGGLEVWNAKLAWAGSKVVDGKAVPGGYTKAQVDAFNEGMKKGGQAAAEQIELMNARFAKANPDATTTTTTTPNKTPAPEVGLKKRRAASPTASASGGGTATAATGPKPFADRNEHQKAMADIRNLPQAQQEAEHQKVRARLAASPWWRNGKK
jgi:hypothetical protein